MNSINKIMITDFYLRFLIGLEFYKKENYKSAFLFFFISAQYCIGLMYYKGLGRIKDLDKAKKYFTLAAENYSIKVANKLGLIYKEEKNYDLAIYYLKLATNYGDKYESLF